MRDDAREQYDRMSDELKNDPNIIQDRALYEKTVLDLARYQNSWVPQ